MNEFSLSENSVKSILFAYSELKKDLPAFSIDCLFFFSSRDDIIKCDEFILGGKHI
jgi:hypothetical protein